MQADAAGFRIMFLADSQLGCMATFSGMDAAAIERFARRGMVVRSFAETDDLAWDLARYDAAIGVANELRPDLVVIGGDMVDAIDRPEQLEAFRAATDRLEIPIRYVAGNHDACPDGTIPTEESLSWYEDAFGADHWSFTHDLDGATATLIAVNSTLLDQPRKVPGGDERELAYLEAELRAASGDGPIVVFCHHPPFIDDADEGDQYWTLPVASRRPMLDLLAEHGVDLVLCGHRHRNDRATYRGVEIVTSAATGFPLGLDPPGYRVVDIARNGVDHTYYSLREPGWDDIGGPPEGDERLPVSGDEGV